MENQPQTSSRIARSTAVVALAFATAKAISLLQTFIIARTFGVGYEYDAFVTANRAPELIVTLIAGGSLGFAFIPIFSGLLGQGKREDAWEVASHVINTVFLAALILSALTFAIAPWLVGVVYAPGFPPDIQLQTITLLRILLISTLVFSVSGIIQGILQSHNHFLSPALAPIMFDLGILFGVVYLIPTLGIYGIAWGAVLGACLHFLVQVPALFHFGARWKLAFGFRSARLWLVVRLMLPRIAGLGVFYFNFTLMNNLASRLGEGSVSALSWGWQLTQIPQTLLGTALGIVVFPTLASLSESGKADVKQTTLNGILKFMLIATIPAMVGLILIGQPLISLLEGGAFDSSATDLVYASLRAFALSIVVMSILEIMARSFYADKDTLTPLWAALVGAAVNFVLAIYLSGFQLQIDWLALRFTLSPHPTPLVNLGVAGLGLALSLGILLEITLLILILRRRWQWSVWNELGSTFVRVMLASVLMGAVVWLVNLVWEQMGLANQGRLLTLVQISVLGVVGVLSYVLWSWIFRIREIFDFMRMLLQQRGQGMKNVN